MLTPPAKGARDAASMDRPEPLERLDPFDDEGRLRVVIEATAGTRSKLKYEPRLGAFELHHAIPAGTAFPLDFGFIPGTLGEDGDPLDGLVFADEAIPAGILVPARLLGVIEATQAREGKAPTRNDRFLAVASASLERAHWQVLADVPDSTLEAIESFFVSYNAQRGVHFRPLGRRDAAHARQLIVTGASAAASADGRGLRPAPQ